MKPTKLALYWKLSGIVFAAITLLWLSGCKGAEGPTGPPGPKLTGTLKGFVSLVSENGTFQTDASGVAVSVSGTTISANSDVNGKFQLDNVETGTYEIVYTKGSYGVFKRQGISFASGGTAGLSSVTLGTIPVSSPIPVLTPTSTSGVSVTVNGALTTAATTAQYYRVYLGKTSTIDPLNPSTFVSSQFATVAANSSAFQSPPSWSVATLRSFGIIASNTPNLWFVCYPYNQYCSSYTDINTNVSVYPAVTSQGSSPVSATTP